GAAALFGISFGILPALLLLCVLALYDAISVYGTEHMLTLASGVMDLRVPVLIIIPTAASYSFLEDQPTVDEKDAAESGEGSDGRCDDRTGGDVDGTGAATDSSDGDEGEFDRDAIFIGLGDAVMPSILVASATVFLETPLVYGVEVAPLTTILGTTVGLVILLAMVVRGRAHAGLPLLNGGAILGYLLGALASGLSLSVALGVDAAL
ncbi:MAG: presenilin family intramembrane aspartyl protease PSH, partial [Halanaeroarchaeum sp.]